MFFHHDQDGSPKSSHSTKVKKASKPNLLVNNPAYVAGRSARKASVVASAKKSPIMVGSVVFARRGDPFVTSGGDLDPSQGSITKKRLFIRGVVTAISGRNQYNVKFDNGLTKANMSSKALVREEFIFDCIGTLPPSMQDLNMTALNMKAKELKSCKTAPPLSRRSLLLPMLQ